MKRPLIKILRSKVVKRIVLIGGRIALIAVFAWVQASTAATETIDPNVKKNEDPKIRITADKLIAEVDTGNIEFVGNVKATQADSVITADRLKIIYDPATLKSQTRVNKPESIKKIIAKGHVKIIYDNIIAETDKAEYTMKSAVLVLEGEHSNVTRGGHSIAATKFTLHRSDGKITVESSGKNRVKAVFQSSQKDK